MGRAVLSQPHTQASLVSSLGGPETRAILGSGMAFRPELGPVSILWVADACSLALGWTMVFSCNCSMASTYLHAQIARGKSKTQWSLLVVHLKYTQET